MSQLPQHYKVKPVQRSQRRIASYLALVLGVGLTAYTFIGRFSEIPAIKDFNKLNDFDGIREDSLDLQPASTNMIQISDLPSKYLPETGKHRTSGRLVIVGDVHGMKKSLVALLHKVKFDEKYDHLIFTGDMISKGPDSTGVVDLAMELGATSVRGNHEDRIILEHAKMAAKEASADQPTSNNGADKVQDGLGEKEELSRAENKDRALVKALGEKRIGWLEKCPVILRIGKLGSLGNVLVVHAGLVPGIELEKQDPSLVMTMRTIGEDGVPTEDRTGQAWMKVCSLRFIH
jgi:hypothetical protein